MDDEDDFLPIAPILAIFISILFLLCFIFFGICFLIINL